MSLSKCRRGFTTSGTVSDKGYFFFLDFDVINGEVATLYYETLIPEVLMSPRRYGRKFLGNGGNNDPFGNRMTCPSANILFYANKHQPGHGSIDWSSINSGL